MSQEELSLSIALLPVLLHPSQIRPEITSGFSKQDEGLNCTSDGPQVTWAQHETETWALWVATTWLQKLRRPSVSRCSHLRPLVAGGGWVLAASQPTQTPGEVTAGSCIPKGCFLLVLRFFPTSSHIWWHYLLSSFSLFSSSSSSRCLHCWWGKCHGNDLACKTGNLYTTNTIYKRPVSELSHTVSSSLRD